MHIKTVPVAKGSVYLTCAIDIYSAKNLPRWISNTLSASFCADATTEAVRLYGSPEIINSDQGCQLPLGAFVTQYPSPEQDSACTDKGLRQITFSVERFLRSLKYEEVTLRVYDTVADAKR